ncbi:MAG: hypothetical protein OHK0039_22630 [Bacteroidia bacterium]
MGLLADCAGLVILYCGVMWAMGGWKRHRKHGCGGRPLWQTLQSGTEDYERDTATGGWEDLFPIHP